MRLLRRLQYWKHRNTRSESLREEIELHLAETAAALEAAGMSPQNARAEARRRFGNVGQKREESREVWIARYWSEFVQDVRYGCRMLAANRTFTALAILSLALGIGANTTIYSFMEAILLRALPVADPESLVVFNWHSRPPREANGESVHVMHGLQGMAWPGEKGAMVSGIFPYAALETLAGENAVLSTLFGYCNALQRTLSVRGHASAIATEFVTGGYFPGLDVPPAAGRLIGPDDDRPGAPPVAVLSFAASQSRFPHPSDAIGQPVLVDNVPFTIIGVTPPEFFGVDPASVPGLYLPLQTNRLIDPAFAARLYPGPNFYWLEIMGRLRPGVTLEQAQAALAPRFHRWVASTATTDGERTKLPALVLSPGAAGLGGLRRQYSKPLFLLLAMAGLILAIACANIANLLLARAAARRREIAVRLSLGAGRFRIVRQLLTESLLLASLGGAAGLLFANWGVRALTLLFSNGQENFTLHAQWNGNVLAVSAAFSLLCGFFFGLAPALRSTRLDLLPALKTTQATGPRRLALHALTVAQIAFSFLVLAAAGLFVRTLNNLHSVQLGYTRENVLLFSLNARQAGHHDPEITAFYTDLRNRIASLPGVNAATVAQSSLISAPRVGQPIRGPMRIGSVTLEGARAFAVGDQFLATMQIPLLAGRAIDGRDQPGAPPVAVISQRLAQSYFAGANPIGRRITLPAEKRELEIVGVSANLRYGGLKNEEESALAVFVPLAQIAPERVTFALRTQGDPLRHAATVQAIVRERDAGIPVTNLVTQAAEIDRTIRREITFAHLCSGFALLALLMACVGLYGTMSYSVSRQTAEIGIRMALGAHRRTVIWMVLRHVLLLTAAGLALSLPAAWIGATLIKSFLFGTQPNDPATLALAGIILVSATILAACAPALRASRIDPSTALRSE